MRNALGLFTCCHRSEPGRRLMLGRKSDGVHDGEPFRRRSSGWWHYPVPASTMCGKRKSAAE